MEINYSTYLASNREEYLTFIKKGIESPGAFEVFFQTPSTQGHSQIQSLFNQKFLPITILELHHLIEENFKAASLRQNVLLVIDELMTNYKRLMNEDKEVNFQIILNHEYLIVEFSDNLGLLVKDNLKKLGQCGQLEVNFETEGAGYGLRNVLNCSMALRILCRKNNFTKFQILFDLKRHQKNIYFSYGDFE